MKMDAKTSKLKPEPFQEFNRPKPGGRKPLMPYPVYGIPPVVR
jgi:hypothetical protein